MNTRTILIAFGLLLGGGVGAGGVSSLIAPKVPAEMAAEIHELSERSRQMDSRLRDVETALHDVGAQLKADAGERDRVSKELDDHENRIRAIERRLR